MIEIQPANHAQPIGFPQTAPKDSRTIWQRIWQRFTGVRYDIRVEEEKKWLESLYPEIISSDYVAGWNRGTKEQNNFSEETRQMRKMYRHYAQSNPTVKAALYGKIAAVVANKVNFNAPDPDDPQQVAEAEACKLAFTGAKSDYRLALIEFAYNLLVDGWAVSEPRWTVGEQGALKGKWVLHGMKAKDTDNLNPITDQFRNVIAIESRRDGNHWFDPDAFMISRYMPTFESATGLSDLRAAYSAICSRNDAIRLRVIYLNKFSGPFIVGKVGDTNRLQQMHADLVKARGNQVLTVQATDTIDVVNLATTGTDAFKTAIEDYDKEIVIAIHGAYLHMMEGNNTDARGNSSIAERVSQAFKWLLSIYLEAATKSGFCEPFMRFNYGSDRPIPNPEFEAIDPTEILQHLQIDEMLLNMGLALSKKQLYRSANRTKPTDPDDVLVRSAPVQPNPAAPTLPSLDFAEGDPPDPSKKALPPLTKPATSGEVALAGKDGKAAANLLKNSKAKGVETLSRLAEQAVSRWLKSGTRGGPLFTDEERRELADSLAATNATAHLLGRSRLREMMNKAEKAKGLFRIANEQPFDSFDEIPTFRGITPLPPVEAASYFQKLVPSLDNLNVRLFENQMRRESMTLAVATEKTLIKKVQEAIQTGLESGGKEASKFDLNTILSEAGVTPKNPQYAEMVYRTNAMDSYNAGLQAEYQAPDVKAFFPVWQYLGIDDGRQGKDHAVHFNKFYPSSASFEEVRGDRPFNCRCTPRPIDKYTWAEMVKRGARVETSWGLAV